SRRFSLEAERVDACHDERLEVRAFQPSSLELLYCFVHELVQLEKFFRATAARLERIRQLRAKELVASLEDRVICAARKTTILLVAQSERHQRRFLELGRKLPLRAIVQRGQRLGETRDFQRPLTKVVRLLRVEQQNAV